jgi:hypothetical protein
LFGVLDVDSDKLAAFDATDAVWCVLGLSCNTFVLNPCVLSATQAQLDRICKLFLQDFA